LTEPDVGSSSVLMMRIDVVFPAPLGPMNPKMSPSATPKLTPRTAQWPS
jgi:hypothetical protein